jgi:hypothetical protein
LLPSRRVRFNPAGRLVDSGMDMNGKTKFLILGLVLAMALGFFSHFWSYMICVLEKAIAVGIVPLLLSKVAAGIIAMHLLL